MIAKQFGEASGLSKDTLFQFESFVTFMQMQDQKSMQDYMKREGLSVDSLPYRLATQYLSNDPSPKVRPFGVSSGLGGNDLQHYMVLVGMLGKKQGKAALNYRAKYNIGENDRIMLIARAFISRYITSVV